MAATAKQIDAAWSGFNNPTNGKSYSGAIVAFFEAGTTTPKAVWLDKNKTLPSAAGITQTTLSENGIAKVFGDGIYKINIYSPNDTGLTTPLAGSIDGATYIPDVDPTNIGYDSISDMRAGTGGVEDGSVVSLLGYHSQGDGGGGQFYWDASSVEADDNGTIIKVTSITTGRWKRIFERPATAMFGAYGDESNDDSTAVQNAIDYCLDNNILDLDVSGVSLLSSSVNIDRQVDGAAFDEYFTLHNGGFVVNTAIPMFTSSIAFTTAPVSQLVQFNNIHFSSTNSALNAYVLDDARFLRTQFNHCDFVKIKCLYAPTVFCQSLYFNHCNYRRWTGTFFRSLNVNFDINFTGGLAEAGENFAEMPFPVGCSFDSGMTIEGMSGTAIRYWGAQGFNITNCYFEQNDRDIDGTDTLSVATSYGVTVSGNYLSHLASAGYTPYLYSTIWDRCENSQAFGNYGSGTLHELSSTANVEINDFAEVNVTNLDTAQQVQENVVSAHASSTQSLTSAVFEKAVIDTKLYDPRVAFDTVNSRYTPKVAGYYSVTCKAHFTGTLVRTAISIYKNGASVERITDISVNTTAALVIGGTGEVYMNGTTDFLELWVYAVGATPGLGYNDPGDASRLTISLIRAKAVR